MGILLGVYKELAKEAEVAQTYEMLQERVSFLNKYAEVATELLNAEFPNNFDKNDVIELADKLIRRDAEIAEAQAKVAEAKETVGEYVKAARALLEQEGADFTDSTVEKLASSLFELDAEEQFYKEATVIAEASFVDEFNKIAGTDFTTMLAIEESIKEAGMASVAAGFKNVMGKIKDLPMEVMTNPKTTKAVRAIKENPGVVAAGAAGFVGRGLLDRAASKRTAGGDN